MSKGGDKFDYENLAVCCHRCNQKKDDMSWDRWVKSMSLKEQFTHKMKNGYVKFDSTYLGGFPLGETYPIDSQSNFRETHKKINPSELLKDDVIKIINDKIGDKLDRIEWEEEFRQFYVYMWPKLSRTQVDYLNNKKKLILSFYEDEWIFCSICDENNGRYLETHYVCDYIPGFESFLDDQRDYLTTKQ